MESRVGRDPSGFTLIELMIVVTILSLLTLSVSLGSARPRDGNAQDWSRFAALHDALRAQAILSGETLGLSVDEGGYQRMRWQDGAWRLVGTRGNWREPVLMILPRARPASLVFGPGGRASAFDLRFGTGTGATLCASDGWTPVSCARI